MVSSQFAIDVYDELSDTVIGSPPVQRLGQYDILDVLGCGGQSMVLKAWDSQLCRHVVIKLYHDTCDPDVERQRVLREGRALSRVHHPHVCNCLAVSSYGSMSYLVLQYVPGETLQQRLQWRTLTWAEAVMLVRKLCRAVTAIHRAGLLHCDLKPANVIVDDDNEPSVIDLGLSVSQVELTPRDVSGTPAYLAPERARGDVEAVDERCDVFGLGAILYELLGGRAPFAHERRSQSRRLAVAGIVAPLTDADLPDGLNEVLMRALVRHPAGRYRTVAEFETALVPFDETGQASCPRVS